MIATLIEEFIEELNFVVRLSPRQKTFGPGKYALAVSVVITIDVGGVVVVVVH